MVAQEELEGFEHFQAMFGLQLIAARVPDTLWPLLFRAACFPRAFPFVPAVEKDAVTGIPRRMLRAERNVQRGEIFATDNHILFGVNRLPRVMNHFLSRDPRHWDTALHVLKETGSLFAVPQPNVRTERAILEGISVALSGDTVTQFISERRLTVPSRRYITAIDPDCFSGLDVTEFHFLGGVSGDSPCAVLRCIAPSLCHCLPGTIIDLPLHSFGGTISADVVADLRTVVEALPGSILRIGPIMTATGATVLNTADLYSLPALTSHCSCAGGALEFGGVYHTGLLQLAINDCSQAQISVDISLLWPEYISAFAADLRCFCHNNPEKATTIALIALPDSVETARELLALPISSLNSYLCGGRSFAVTRNTLTTSRVNEETGVRQRRPCLRARDTIARCPSDLLDQGWLLSEDFIGVLHDALVQSLRLGFDAVSDKFTLVLPQFPYMLFSTADHRSTAHFRLIVTPQKTFALCLKEVVAGEVATCDPLSAGFEGVGFSALGSSALRLQRALISSGMSFLKSISQIIPESRLPDHPPPLSWMQRNTAPPPQYGPNSTILPLVHVQQPKPAPTTLAVDEICETSVPQLMGPFGWRIAADSGEAHISPEELGHTLFSHPVIWINSPEFEQALSASAPQSVFAAKGVSLGNDSRTANLVFPCTNLLGERDAWTRFSEILNARKQNTDIDQLLQCLLPADFAEILNLHGSKTHDLPQCPALLCQLPSAHWLTDPLELRRTIITYGDSAGKSVIEHSWLLPAQINSLCAWMQANSIAIEAWRDKLGAALTTPSLTELSSDSSSASSSSVPRIEQFDAIPESPGDEDCCERDGTVELVRSILAQRSHPFSRDVQLQSLAGNSSFPHFFTTPASTCTETEPSVTGLGCLMAMSDVVPAICTPVAGLQQVWDADIHVLVRRLLPDLDFLISSKIVLGSKCAIGGTGAVPDDTGVQLAALDVYEWARAHVSPVLAAYARRLEASGANPDALARYCGLLTFRVRLTGNGNESFYQLIGVSDGFSPKRFCESDCWCTEMAHWSLFLLGQLDPTVVASLGIVQRPTYRQDRPDAVLETAAEPPEPRGYLRQHF